MASAYDAGAANLPFAMLRTHAGSLAGVNPHYRSVTCPFTGETLIAVPALSPTSRSFMPSGPTAKATCWSKGSSACRKKRCWRRAARSSRSRKWSTSSTDRRPTPASCRAGRSPPSRSCRAVRSRRTRIGITARNNPFYLAWDDISRTRETFTAWLDEHVSWRRRRTRLPRRTPGRMTSIHRDELLTVAAARAVNNDDVCFVGIGLPSAACNLARLTHAPRITLIYESGTIGTRPSVLPLSIGDGELCATALTTVSVPEFFRYWLPSGRISVGFLGAAQIDRFANLNTTVIGPYAAYRPACRAPVARRKWPSRVSASSSSCRTPAARSSSLDFLTSLGHGGGGNARARLGLVTGRPGQGDYRSVRHGAGRSDARADRDEPAPGNIVRGAAGPARDRVAGRESQRRPGRDAACADRAMSSRSCGSLVSALASSADRRSDGCNATESHSPTTIGELPLIAMTIASSDQETLVSS